MIERDVVVPSSSLGTTQALVRDVALVALLTAEVLGLFVACVFLIFG